MKGTQVCRGEHFLSMYFLQQQHISKIKSVSVPVLWECICKEAISFLFVTNPLFVCMMVSLETNCLFITRQISPHVLCCYCNGLNPGKEGIYFKMRGVDFGGTCFKGFWIAKNVLKCLCLFFAFFPNTSAHRSFPFTRSLWCGQNFILIWGDGLCPCRI